MITYSLINPSDQVTFQARSFEAALIAAVLLGGGLYAARSIPEGDGEDVPMFLGPSFTPWFANRYPDVDFTGFAALHNEDAIEALESLVYGNRADFDAGYVHAPDKTAFRWQWNERKRTSMTNIVAIADSIVVTLRERAA